jgi:adenylyltransferase/sulfurtransferase
VATCEGAGILGPVAGVVGSLQAVEALKVLLGLEATAAGRLLLFDGLGSELGSVTVRRDPACPACGGLPHKELTGR